MLGTKLKNNKKLSIIIAGLLVLAAAVSYFAMYPAYEKRASAYYTNILHREIFLNELYQASCVFYKDIQEKVRGEAVDYAELYVTFQNEPVTDEPASGISIMEKAAVADAQSYFVGAMYGRMNSWREEVLNGIARQMDYCVIDNLTGTSIKNTGENLERLATQGADEELDSIYPYYVMVAFDGIGNLESVMVKSSSSDELLKAVQSVMRQGYLQDYAARGLRLVGNDLYYADTYDGAGLRRLRTEVRNTPRDTTFIFAFTAEQLMKYQDGNYLYDIWNEETAYYQAGAHTGFRMIQLILGIIAILLPLCGFYELPKGKRVKLPLEIGVIGCFVLFGVGCSLAIRLMTYTNKGYLEQAYLRYLSWLPAFIYPILTGTINILALFALFALWYYLVTSFGELWELGIKEFVCERSLIVKNYRRVSKFLRQRADSFKYELLHVDLGEKADKTIKKIVFINFLVMSAVCFMWIFGWIVLVVYALICYIALKKYIRRIQEQYGRLLVATRSIAEGNLQTEFQGDWGIFESYKQELEKIEKGFRKAVEEEVKSQRMKTELITNVSHDLKTPLTAITTYVELLKDENLPPGQQKEYLYVLERKASRLKFLIEDLFEVSRVGSGNVTLHPVDVDICNLMRQVYLEYEDKVEEADLIFRFAFPKEKVILSLDSQKTYRIFENLYTNIIKYAMPHTRVYVQVQKEDDRVNIQLKNMSASELNIPPRELTERFVRGDSSRNTEGNGLGLAIAKGFTELQKGKMQVEIDGDLFKVTLEWSAAK